MRRDACGESGEAPGLRRGACDALVGARRRPEIVPRRAGFVVVVALICVGSPLVGCSDDVAANRCVPRAVRLELVDNARWEPLDVSDDPFAAHRPSPVRCPELAILLEGEVLEINTELCNYFAVVQALPQTLRPCEPVQLVMTHEALFFDEPATAHVALHIGEHLVWEERVDIPGPRGLLAPTFQVPEEIPAGSPVKFHLHNHGVNTWNLLSVTRLAP